MLTTLRLAKSLTWLSLFLMLLIRETKTKKSLSAKEKLEGCWNRNKESIKKTWNPFLSNRCHIMSSKIYTTGCSKNRKDKENKGSTSLDLILWQWSNARIDLPNQNKIFQVANLHFKITSSRPGLYPGIVKIIFLTESIERNKKEKNKFWNRLLISTLIMNCLMVFREWSRDKNKKKR